MADHIHILGMPRSGTAFVSAVLNLHPSCICFHEPCGVPGWKKRIQDAAIGMQYLGMADTYSGKFPLYTLPHARCVYLRRPLDDSLKAIRKFHWMEEDSLENISETNEAWASDRKALIIENPFDMKALRQIWNHVFRENLQGNQSHKLERFITLNIQRHNLKESLPGAQLHPD